jgi:hypothetical protein
MFAKQPAMLLHCKKQPRSGVPSIEVRSDQLKGSKGTVRIALHFAAHMLSFVVEVNSSRTV